MEAPTAIVVHMTTDTPTAATERERIIKLVRSFVNPEHDTGYNMACRDILHALELSSTMEARGANAHINAAPPDLFDALKAIKWKSADKDNMEFSALIPYNIMDTIRAALAKTEART